MVSFGGDRSWSRDNVEQRVYYHLGVERFISGELYGIYAEQGEFACYKIGVVSRATARSECNSCQSQMKLCLRSIPSAGQMGL